MAKFVFNFKKQFAHLVRSGTKLQTIRANRADKKRPTPGDVACLYTGLRSNKTELLREAAVLSCRAVRMDLECGDIVVDGQLLGREDAEAFAQADGFATRAALLAWFNDQHGGGTFEGFVTTWSAVQESRP